MILRINPDLGKLQRYHYVSESLGLALDSLGRIELEDELGMPQH